MRTLVLLASHELDQALAIADRILIISGEPATLGADLSVPRGEGPSAVARLRGDLLSRFRFLNVQGNPITTGSEVQASVHPGP
jgi:ABC-type nitrate/sulfonate/bicarbonate transport system ATPase subunit